VLAQFCAALLFLWTPVSARILALVLQLYQRNKLKLKLISRTGVQYSLVRVSWTSLTEFDSRLSRILHHDIHWLDVPRRVIFKLCMTVYKCLHGLAPKYTSPSCAFRLQMLPAAEDFWIYLATTCQTVVDVRSVSPVLTSGTHFLRPEHIRQSTSIAVFKRSLKTFRLQQISHL